MSDNKLTDFGRYLQLALDNVQAHDEYFESRESESKFHVQNTGKALVFAYEQLRSASENIEDHLLLQAAIRRYLKRISATPTSRVSELAEELITELTQAEYLENDSVAVRTVSEIQSHLRTYVNRYSQISSLSVEREKIKYMTWLLDIASVRIEQLLNNSSRDLAIVHVAHTFFSKEIKFDKLIDVEEKIPKDQLHSLLYIALHKAVLKSNDANARVGLIDLCKVKLTSTEELKKFNENYDKLASSKSAVAITKFITKNGAPIRIIKDYFFTKQEHINPNLSHKNNILLGISHQISQTTQTIKTTRNKAVFKSIVFLLLTKALIGLFIEIPYDILVTGGILVLPLVVNILLPPVFLALSALTFKLPGEENKIALEKYIGAMIYSDEGAHPPLRYRDPIGSSVGFNILYAVIFIAAMYLMATRLASIGFNALQEVLFFIFFSTAAFLGFRITLQIKEIELLQTNQGFVALVRDLLYSPFIFLGRRISYRFGKLNIIARILDIAVDLPLKAFMRLVRQWVKFLNNKKEELD